MWRLIYTALGDSISVGMNGGGDGGYVRRIITDMRGRSDAPVRGGIIAGTGWTSSALVGATQCGIGRLRVSDTVSIWIGGNDLGFSAMRGGIDEKLIEAALVRYAHNLHRICGTVRQVSGARIVLCTQYNPFPNSKIACQGVAALNAVTKKVAKEHKATVAPVHKWFDGNQARLIDGYRSGRLEDALQPPRPIHPNERGHAVIASGLFPYVRGK